MDEKWSFGVSFPDIPIGRRLTADEAEVLLHSRMQEKRAEFEVAVWQLVRFYSISKQPEIAAKYIAFLMSLTDDPERQAAYWLALGQTMEQVGDFQAAAKYYRQAFSMEPTESDTWYFINNNLAYCLIQLGQFQEAEPYCRAAIRIGPRKQNAYKNLGLALQGQGKYSEAAKSYVLAVRANSADPRALQHLEALLQQHPEVAADDPGITGLLTSSRDAVSFAARLIDGAMKKHQDESPELTHVEKILVAIYRLVFLDGTTEFSRDDIRKILGLTMEDWMSDYNSIFQAMQEDEPGSAPPIDEKYRGIFKQVRHGVHSLTPYGHGVVQRIHNM
jgi:tetratricopeptide (TPR) repeat protein